MAENKEFATAQAFPYRLLADTDRTLGEPYGVQRPPDDERAHLPLRFTFLIDPEGVVRKIYEVTDTAAHPGEVLDDILAMKSG